MLNSLNSKSVSCFPPSHKQGCPNVDFKVTVLKGFIQHFGKVSKFGCRDVFERAHLIWSWSYKTISF